MDQQWISMEYGSDDASWIEDWSETDVEEDLYEAMEEEMEKDESDEEVEKEEEMEEDGPLTIPDPDLLDCPICMEPLSIPVYQCENGHVSCASCCLKIQNTCPSCSLKIGRNRCLFAEKLLESFTAPCKFKKHGCGEMLKYCNKKEHEKICPLTPCSCPVTGCNFEGSTAALYSHFSCSHIFYTLIFTYDEYTSVRLERSQRHLIFGGEDGAIFVLNKFNEDKGSVINVVRISPSHSAELDCKIRAKYNEASISLRSSIENFQKWEHSRPEKNILFVPDYCTNSEGQLLVDICIFGTEESPANSPEVSNDVN